MSEHSGTTTEPRPEWSPPSRARVFGEFWWRSFVIAQAGGAAIGLVAGPVIIIADSSGPGPDGLGESVLRLLGTGLLGVVVGAAFGFLLGLFAGVVIATVGAVGLVPYRGDAITRRVLRATAVVVVGLFWMVLVDSGERGVVAFIVVPSLVAAWWLAPRIGDWYANWVNSHRDTRPVPGRKVRAD